MPQTRFVLKKALELGKRVVVVVNKIDRTSARPAYVVDTTFELFCDLKATDEQVRALMDFDFLGFIRGQSCSAGYLIKNVVRPPQPFGFSQHDHDSLTTRLYWIDHCQAAIVSLLIPPWDGSQGQRQGRTGPDGPAVAFAVRLPCGVRQWVPGHCGPGPKRYGGEPGAPVRDHPALRGPPQGQPQCTPPDAGERTGSLAPAVGCHN